MGWETTLAWSTAQARAKIISKIRLFFAARNVTEVDTPLLSNGTITDAHIEAFDTRYNFLSDTSVSVSASLFLQTSPEFAMKRLIASGYGCIFQVCKAFRHEGYGKHHNPEFTMLEWYRIGFTHTELMEEVGELLIEVLSCNTPKKVTYQQLFIEHLSIDPLATSHDELKSYLVAHELSSAWLLNSEGTDTLLQYLFSEVIEPKIGTDEPCFVYNFPSSQASLAKISCEDTRVAERFECYYQGVELANGFHELTNVDEQRQRFDTDNYQRMVNKLETKPIDKNFIAALQSGLPDCAGVALGVDRLIMLALNKNTIKEVITYDIEDA